MPESHNLTAMAEALATLMSEDLETTIPTIYVLDWLASTGLTLRSDDGDAAIAYGLALDDELPT